MKNVRLKKIKLLNFKGVRNLEIDFNDEITSIYGKNASGKTTIFDAFTWLLFGKNSDDKAKFNIKTLDAQGNVIERLPHEVSAVLEVDGKTLELCRRLKEKWTKKRGCTVEEFTGNEEERLYNDVPMSVKEWQEKINAICSEDIFRMITNPLYFPTMRWDKQREALIKMAGDVSVDEIVAHDPHTFGALIDQLNGKTLEEYKREILAKKKRIKEEVDTIPSRIDERKRDIVTTYDFALLEAQLHYKEKKAEEITEQLNDARKLMFADVDKEKVSEERRKLKADVDMRKMEIEKSVSDSFSALMSRYIKAKTQIAEAESKIQYLNMQNDMVGRQLVTARAKRGELLAKYKELKSLTLEFNDTNFVCPTCGRPLDADQIEQKQQEMIMNFNRNKAEQLERNIEQGKAVKAEIEKCEQTLKSYAEQLDKLNADLAKWKEEIPAEPQPLSRDEVTKIIIKDERYLMFCKRLQDYDKAHTESESTDNGLQAKVDELSRTHKELMDKISEIKTQLSIKYANESNERRIKELETELRNASEELTRLEGIEFTIKEFTEARINLIEERINSLFQLVRFKMFETQINGGEVETCKATVNGVPFEDLNSAMRINAGLDIINAICKTLQTTAPIFCDNSESVNQLIATQSQIVRLVVSEDETLRIA